MPGRVLDKLLTVAKLESALSRLHAEPGHEAREPTH
jgi:hypothetical protein